MKIKELLLVLALSAMTGALFGALSISFYSGPRQDQNMLISDFYATENAVHVSPHSLRKALLKGDTGSILVDLRSEQEYELGHIVSAINIPAYKDPDTAAYGDTERIVSSFKALPKGKDIIVYCYSSPCMTGRKIGK